MVKKLHQSSCELTGGPYSEAVEGKDDGLNVVRSVNLMHDQLDKLKIS